MKDIKIIFFDIDGTLIALDRDNISKKTQIALNKLKDKGIKIAIATGRGTVQIPKFDGVDFTTYLSFNGSLCTDHGEDIHTNPIGKDDLYRLMENAKDMDKPLSLAGKDFFVTNYLDEDLEQYYSFGSAMPDLVDDLRYFIENKNIYQTYMSLRESEYERALEGTKDIKIAAWWDRAVDIIPKTAGKGRAIEKVLDYYGFRKDQALAFGDGNNDIEMFEKIRGIAMANASEDLKDLAYDTCKSVDEDGIYHYLKDKELI